MIEKELDCEYCFNQSIIQHEEGEPVCFCPICGESITDDLEEVDFDD